MSYRDELKNKILELELRLSKEKSHALELEIERLKMAEFEEDLREENEGKTLLKG
jgi:hypothetical protein